MNIDALTTYLALSSGSYSGILRDMYAIHNLGLNPDLHTKLLANRFVGVTEELTGTPPLSFKAKGKPLSAWSITGNTVQNGTPTPENPVEVQGVGDYDSDTGLYKIPVVTSADGTESITTPIYLDSPLYKIGGYADRLSETEEVRVVKELAFTGEENITQHSVVNDIVGVRIPTPTLVTANSQIICTHALNVTWANFYGSRTYGTVASNVSAGNSIVYMSAPDREHNTLSDIKSYLAAQYAAGTPVKVYYVMQTPETKTVESVEIPTLNGTTVIDVDTAVKPESMTIKYRR